MHDYKLQRDGNTAPVGWDVTFSTLQNTFHVGPVAPV